MTKTKTLQDSQFATKSEVREIVVEATDAILTGMEKMLENLVTKEEFNKRLGKVDNELAEIKSDIHVIKDDTKNIEADMSVLPSRKEFNELKSKVDNAYV